MKLVVFTMAAVSLLVSGASLVRQHAIAQDLLRVERLLAATPPEIRVIRIEPPPVVAAPAPMPRVARKPAAPHRVLAAQLPPCNPTDPICGIPER